MAVSSSITNKAIITLKSLHYFNALTSTNLCLLHFTSHPHSYPNVSTQTISDFLVPPLCVPVCHDHIPIPPALMLIAQSTFFISLFFPFVTSYSETHPSFSIFTVPSFFLFFTVSSLFLYSTVSFLVFLFHCFICFLLKSLFLSHFSLYLYISLFLITICISHKGKFFEVNTSLENAVMTAGSFFHECFSWAWFLLFSAPPQRYIM